MTREEGIQQVYTGGRHMVFLGAGASIAATMKNSEKSGKMLPSMDNFVQKLGLQDLIDEVPLHLKDDNFEKLYGNLHRENPKSDLLTSIEERIIDYFSDMKLPDEPTIYDYLVLSLRSKDVIATFNWDPFLHQAWVRNRELTIDLPEIYFLHGNVAIGYNRELKARGSVGYHRHEGRVYQFESTKLLYPVEQKNYIDDEFISQEWKAVEARLSKEGGTRRVTIFGYGAPASDVEAVSLLNKAWGVPEDRNMEQFEMIDVASKDILIERWSGFIHSHHYDVCADFFNSSLANNPRRTCEAYFSAYMPRTPREAFRAGNPIPTNFETLSTLWEWHKPLIDAESKKQEKQKD